MHIFVEKRILNCQHDSLRNSMNAQVPFGVPNDANWIKDIC